MNRFLSWYYQNNTKLSALVAGMMLTNMINALYHGRYGSALFDFLLVMLNLWFSGLLSRR
jgi:hypothetical protein